MKPTPVAFLLAFILLLRFTPPSSALQLQGTLWSSNAFYQGDAGTVILTMYADNAGCGCLGMTSYTYVKAIGVQFDWQVGGERSEVSVGQNLSTGSVGTYTLRISIPGNVSAGLHSYSVLFFFYYWLTN
jgi:hypothetical protein